MANVARLAETAFVGVHTAVPGLLDGNRSAQKIQMAFFVLALISSKPPLACHIIAIIDRARAVVDLISLELVRSRSPAHVARDRAVSTSCGRARHER
jgi:hypothetical protein